MNQETLLLPKLIKSLYDDSNDPARLERLENHIIYSRNLGLDYQLGILEMIKAEIEESIFE